MTTKEFKRRVFEKEESEKKRQEIMVETERDIKKYQVIFLLLFGGISSIIMLFFPFIPIRLIAAGIVTFLMLNYSPTIYYNSSNFVNIKIFPGVVMLCLILVLMIWGSTENSEKFIGTEGIIYRVISTYLLWICCVLLGIFSAIVIQDFAYSKVNGMRRYLRYDERLNICSHSKNKKYRRYRRHF